MPAVLPDAGQEKWASGEEIEIERGSRQCGPRSSDSDGLSVP